MYEWEIAKPLGICSGAGSGIGPGEEYIGALVEAEDGLQRQDFCIDYWQEHKPAVYCHWKTKMAHPEQKKRIFVDDEMLMSFFERLGRETEQEKMNFRFVLALILMRRRRLKYDCERIEGETEIWRLRITGEKEFVEVVNPHIDEEQIEQLSSQLGQILHAEL